jgi:hypothetical protein
MGARIDASIVSARGVISPSSLPYAPPTPQPRQSDRTSPHIQPPRPPTGAVQASRVRDRDALLEAIERPTRLEVPVDSRIERGRTLRHALAQLIEHERFDRIVVPAQTSRSDGSPRTTSPGSSVLLAKSPCYDRTASRGAGRQRKRPSPGPEGPRTPAAEGSNPRAPRKCSIKSPRLSRVRCGKPHEIAVDRALEPSVRVATGPKIGPRTDDGPPVRSTQNSLETAPLQGISEWS